MDMFPEGYFYILSRKHGFALDVYDGGISEGTNLIVWPQKFQDSDNQLWSYKAGRLTNKKSGHVIDISSSAFKKDKTIVQKKLNPQKQSQEWVYDQGFICSKEYPSLVLDIRGDSPKGGAQVLLYKRKDTDNLNQLWQFELYQQFESALNIATTSVPLHKKEGFGQPRPGYAAEVGIPPELTKIPENCRIAVVGNNTTPSSIAPGGIDHSRIDPALAQYGSFYGGTTTSPPAAQPVQRPSSNNLYPPPPSNDNQYQAEPPQPGPVPFTPSGYSQGGNMYPTPNSTPSGADYSGSRPPPPGYPGASSSGTGYPTAHQAPPSPSNYLQQQTVYPQAPPSPSNYMMNNAYPPNSPGAPAYPLNNAGYPSPSNFPEPQPPTSSSTNQYYSQRPSGMPNSIDYGGYPPVPPPNNRPPQDQYGYPPYPQ